MTKRMLIDAVHPADVRVAVTNENGRLEEFDFETETKQQNKGNVYLAKVTRVEPSLQAIFVEYGGNRQGFLPFAEVHPDYYQIPVADKEALTQDDAVEDDDLADDVDAGEDDAENIGDDAYEEKASRSQAYKKYKVQEVIKRNQIVLVQVMKEERGTKGASLTTYISLPGRYCVLMPNSRRSGGVSRRIGSGEDRKRLKEVVKELEVPDVMSIIVRTAGVDRKKTEIKRDYDYLVKLWNTIRETTVSSEAPALVHSEGDIIMRSVRDMYDSSYEEIVVEGDLGYKSAKNILKLMIPSHAKKVKEYKGRKPVFGEYGIERELTELYAPEAHLPSGGSIVLHPTEALVAIDVNSGKSTKERNIESTAVATNLEAAEEVARQLRLRDLAGLVVVDFIDMMEMKNRRAVEKALKSALKSDRAKISVGRISSFGLLEMSRQRMRSSLMESNFHTCNMCNGAGVVRSDSSVAMMHMRVIESEAERAKNGEVHISLAPKAAYHLLNHHRQDLALIEESQNVKVFIQGDAGMLGEEFKVDKQNGRPQHSNQQKGENTQKKTRRRKNTRDDKPDSQHSNAQKPADQEQKKPQQQNHQNQQNQQNQKPHHNQKPQKAADEQTDNVVSIDESQNDEVAKDEKPKRQRRPRTRARKSPAMKVAEKTETSPEQSQPEPVVALKEVQEKDAKHVEDESLLKGLWKKITD